MFENAGFWGNTEANIGSEAPPESPLKTILQWENVIWNPNWNPNESANGCVSAHGDGFCMRSSARGSGNAGVQIPTTNGETNKSAKSKVTHSRLLSLVCLCLSVSVDFQTVSEQLNQVFCNMPDLHATLLTFRSL